MPDMKTALHAVLNEWEKAETPLSTSSQEQPASAKQKQYFKVTVGVSQASFNYVRDNPYTTAAQATAALAKQGFKKTSLTSLFTQMIRQGHLSRDKDGKLTALIPEFRPLKATATLRNLGIALRKKAAKAEPPRQPAKVNIDIAAIKKQNGIRAGIATLNASHAQAAPAPTLLTAKQVLETLSIKEAHMLYRELQTMFGG